MKKRHLVNVIKVPFFLKAEIGFDIHHIWKGEIKVKLRIYPQHIIYASLKIEGKLSSQLSVILQGLFITNQFLECLKYGFLLYTYQDVSDGSDSS